MAHIVQFHSGVAREAPEAPSVGRERAQIIIFPGVRRERHAEPPPRDCNRSGPERDRLELPD
jgi:hypothetical protein